MGLTKAELDEINQTLQAEIRRLRAERAPRDGVPAVSREPART